MRCGDARRVLLHLLNVLRVGDKALIEIKGVFQA